MYCATLIPIGGCAMDRTQCYADAKRRGDLEKRVGVECLYDMGGARNCTTKYRDVRNWNAESERYFNACMARVEGRPPG
jgi:hypothetical protein